MRLIDINCPNCGCKIHIEPERKKGKWIQLTKDLAQCSECRDYVDNAIRCGYNYCPNCGAEMDI